VSRTRLGFEDLIEVIFHFFLESLLVIVMDLVLNSCDRRRFLFFALRVETRRAAQSRHRPLHQKQAIPLNTRAFEDGVRRCHDSSRLV